MKFLIMPRLSISSVTAAEWKRSSPSENSSMISVEALIFDLDGTLIDSKRDIAESVHFIQRKYGRSPSPEADIASYIGNGVATLLRGRSARGWKRTLERCHRAI